MGTDIELLLFATDAALVEAADAAGVDGFVIDWEDRRRSGRHRAIDLGPPDSVENLRAIASATRRPVWCRINEPGEQMAQEVDLALRYGVDLILLPMVKSEDEVMRFLALLDGRAQAGILVETVEACERAAALSVLPLQRVYVGLFDLALSRGGGDLFDPLRDGTVERLRDLFKATSFGVGGLTTVDGGRPLPCLELMEMLARVGADFTFLRNSFKRDIVGRSLEVEVGKIRARWRQMCRRRELRT